MSHVSSFNGLTGNVTADDLSLANITVATGTTTAVSTDVTADTFNRLVIDGSGKHTWGSGSGAGDTTLYRSAANVLATDDDIAITTIGKGLLVKTGTNARFGTLTLNGATPVVVANTSVTADTGIFLTVKTVGGTPAFSWVSARSVGTSFSVTGTASDTSVLNWFMVEPIA